MPSTLVRLGPVAVLREDPYAILDLEQWLAVGLGVAVGADQIWGVADVVVAAAVAPREGGTSIDCHPSLELDSGLGRSRSAQQCYEAVIDMALTQTSPAQADWSSTWKA